jgi:hypothetical protein
MAGIIKLRFFIKGGNMDYKLARDKKRALKRKTIIRKIFKRYISQAGLEKLTGLRIIDKDESSRGCSFVNHYDNKHIITLDLISLYSDRVKYGYEDFYYNGRNKRLSFVIGNKKLALRFVILHELGHCILREKEQNSEFGADTYAIEQLKKEGLYNG